MQGRGSEGITVSPEHKCTECTCLINGEKLIVRDRISVCFLPCVYMCVCVDMCVYLCLRERYSIFVHVSRCLPVKLTQSFIYIYTHIYILLPGFFFLLSARIYYLNTVIGHRDSHVTLTSLCSLEGCECIQTDRKIERNLRSQTNMCEYLWKHPVA